ALIKLLKLSVVCCLLLCFSCSTDDDSNRTLDVDQTVLTFQPGVETRTFNITASGEWSITFDGISPYYGPNMASSDWFEISPIQGTGNGLISITTKADSHNNSIVLYIKYGKREKTVTLNQN
ncbi:MAG: BACON domain-containing protein, partial [Tannerella sp.]|nr:BACON domain-containing protein [Tannerella sp.]